jgi:hypothetical protein
MYRHVLVKTVTVVVPLSNEDDGFTTAQNTPLLPCSASERRSGQKEEKKKAKGATR